MLNSWCPFPFKPKALNIYTLQWIGHHILYRILNSTHTFQVHPFIGKPAWLDLFVDKTFFDVCSVHDFSKNYRNKYCINCDLALCQHCVTSYSHDGHVQYIKALSTCREECGSRWWNEKVHRLHQDSGMW